MIADCHSHHISNNAIINIYPQDTINDKYIYSIGIHPWTLDYINENLWIILNNKAKSSKVIAIGECGFDTIRNKDLKKQQSVFLRHVELSETLKKPLIVHCVKNHKKLIELKKTLNPVQSWIFHGFRLKPQIAYELLDNDIYISFGELFNKESIKIVPEEKMLIETDDSKMNINEIADKIAIIKKNTTLHIINNSIANIKRIFSI